MKGINEFVMMESGFVVLVHHLFDTMPEIDQNQTIESGDINKKNPFSFTILVHHPLFIPPDRLL